jgi:thymidylate synthase (FAD)
MKTRLIWITPDAEEAIMYCARASNPEHQDSGDVKLLRYCANKKHWSIFEMASACFEIETSRTIAHQILRHRSFSFQEFSQRYAKVLGFETYEARRQDEKDRQNSTDDLPEEVKNWFIGQQEHVQNITSDLYFMALEKGIAKESARFLLPESATTKIYMTGTLRSWIHYLQVRSKNEAQKEHRDIALSILDELSLHVPTIAEASGWTII